MNSILNRFWIALVLVLLMVLVACSTAPEIKVTHVKDNRYYVRSAGSAMTDIVDVHKQFEAASEKVCKDNGYAGFKTADVNDETNYVVVGQGTFPRYTRQGYVECV